MLAFSIYFIKLAVENSQTTVEEEGNLFTKNSVSKGESVYTGAKLVFVKGWTGVDFEIS